MFLMGPSGLRGRDRRPCAPAGLRPARRCTLDYKTLNEPGKAYCGSLIGQYRHIADGAAYFQGLIRAFLPQAVRALLLGAEPEFGERPVSREELKGISATTLSQPPDIHPGRQSKSPSRLSCLARP
jgi:hypothetical protein